MAEEAPEGRQVIVRIRVPPVCDVVCRQCGEPDRLWREAGPEGVVYVCEACGCRWPIQQPETD